MRVRTNRRASIFIFYTRIVSMDLFNNLVARLNPLGAADPDAKRTAAVSKRPSKQQTRRPLRSEWHLTKKNEKRSSSRHKKARRRMVTQRRGLPPSPLMNKAKTLKQRRVKKAKAAKLVKPTKPTKPTKPAKSAEAKAEPKAEPYQEPFVVNRELALPKCDKLSQFPISDTNIDGFKRYVNRPNDCVINALQLMNVLDKTSGNIMRLSIVGYTGVSKEQIESMFIVSLRHNFEFKSSRNYNEFAETIKQTLKPGHAVFAGYKTDNPVENESIAGKHVFILARTKKDGMVKDVQYPAGTILYIDPQLSVGICDIAHCENMVLPTGRDTTWFLLFNSESHLTDRQLKHMGFDV